MKYFLCLIVLVGCAESKPLKYKQGDIVLTKLGQVNNIVCNVPCETKFRKRQPFLVMQGWATEVKIKDGVAIIS